MRIAYFDCFSGASGDMILGACLDAGLDLEALRGDLACLGVEGYAIEAQRVRKQGFGATQFDVRVDTGTDKPHRHLKHIREIIQGSRLSEQIRERALSVFARLAEVEAQAHDTTIEKVHFHEVGAIDAIVDIVGACIALDRLKVGRVYCSPIPTGNGVVHCEHGIMPVPAPATAALLKGVPLAECDEPGELTTPTGAAILTTLAQGYGPIPGMVIERIGVGAGRHEGKTRPNIMRILIGEMSDTASANEEADEVLVLEANLDDVTGEVIGHVYELLFAAGALDVYSTPIYMKKNRPATLLTVLAPPELRETIEDILFAETTTFGIRTHQAARHKLARAFETVETPAGPIRIKVGRRAGQIVTVSPEFEDCREAARKSSRPLVEVMELALRAWRSVSPSGKG
jgi:pyridinium-3,5-bisthiocarboxylic acid mononucleotide nickel chelatase